MSALPAFLRKFRRNNRGAAAAEFALMVPLMVIMIFAGLEGGYYMFSEHKVIKAVRDGARFAGRQQFSIFDCDAGAITDSLVVANIKNVTRTGTIDASAAPVVPGWDDNATEVDIDVTCVSSSDIAGIYSDEASGAPIVTVSAKVPYPTLFGPIALGLNDTDLNASAQAAVMGL